MPGRQGECAKGHRWLVPILRMSRSWRMGIRSARDTDGVRPVIIDRRYVVLGCQQYDCRAMDDHKGTRGRVASRRASSLVTTVSISTSLRTGTSFYFMLRRLRSECPRTCPRNRLYL